MTAMVAFHDPVEDVGEASFQGPVSLGGRLAFRDVAQVVVLPLGWDYGSGSPR